MSVSAPPPPATSAGPQLTEGSEPLALAQRSLLALLLAVCAASVLACRRFWRVVRLCDRRRTAFNRLLLARAAVLQANLTSEMVMMVIMLQRWWTPSTSVCFVPGLVSGLCAFTITYLTMWLSLVRLLLLAVSRWAPRHGWRLSNSRIYVLILLLYVPSAGYFVLRYQPTIPFYICTGLPIASRPSGNTTALGVLFLVSMAASTLLLYADATLPPAPPRHRNVLSARRFAVFTLCEQLLVLLWVPATALTAGFTRALLTRVLMIGQAGLLDTLGLALLSPQLRAVLLGRQWRPASPRRAPKVAPVPVIRLELI